MIAKLLENNCSKEFIRYFVASLVSLLIDTAVYLFLGKIFNNYLISAVIGYLTGLLVNYYLSIKWVFSYRKIVKFISEFSIFALVGFFGLLLNEAVIYVGLYIFYLLPFWAKMVSASLSFLFNFSARKFLLYTKGHRL
ncbi:MAG: GtrA family protein [Desulfurella sp.]|jgi:putative flippase GtrA